MAIITIRESCAWMFLEITHDVQHVLFGEIALCLETKILLTLQ